MVTGSKPLMPRVWLGNCLRWMWSQDPSRPVSQQGRCHRPHQGKETKRYQVEEARELLERAGSWQEPDSMGGLSVAARGPTYQMIKGLVLADQKVCQYKLSCPRMFD